MDGKKDKQCYELMEGWMNGWIDVMGSYRVVENEKAHVIMMML